MEIVIDRPPRTIMEVYRMLPEGTLAELIDNAIYMSPAPLFNHQDILFEIAQAFKNHLKRENLGKLIISPFDVYLDNTSNAVQPDITIILNTNAGKLEGQFYGVPDLIVEILSQGNRDYDLKKKRDLYKKFGVREYWIVDPETKQTLCYSLENGDYKKIHEATGEINSVLLQFGFSF